jgi:hypothetical protein
MALQEMGELLHYLLVSNCDSDSRRYELGNEVRRSQEWQKLTQAIAGSRPKQSSPKTLSNRKRTEKSRRMAKATLDIQAILKSNRTSIHKDIVTLADGKKIQPPWVECQTWSDAWAQRENSVRTFLSRAKKGISRSE